MKYKVIDKAENINESVIEKSGIKVQFTLRQMQEEQRELDKYITQFQAQVSVEKAKMDNIERNHPFVFSMSEQDLFTAHMYQESKELVKQLEAKLPELVKQHVDSKEELDEIKEKLGLYTAEEVVALAMNDLEHGN